MSKTATIPFFSLFLLSFFLWTVPVLAQGKVKIPNYEDDSLTCSKNLTFVHNLLKENKLTEAVQPWRWTFMHCPAASENIYIEGAEIFNFIISQEPDSARRQIFVDTLMMIYDQRIRYFKKEGYVLGRKGVELYKLRPWQAKQALDILKQSVDMQYSNSRPAILVNYFNVALELQKQGVVDTFRVYQAYDEVRAILDYNVYYNNKESNLFADAKAAIEQAYDAFSPCDELDARYGPVYMSDTSNVDQIISIIHAFEQRQCYGSRLYLYLMARIYEHDPCGATALKAGKFFITSKHLMLAMKYFQIATKSLDTAAMYEAHLNLEDLYLKSYKDFGEASFNLERAIQLKPDQSTAYLLLGDLYILSANVCGELDLQKYGMYWIAADKYEKAKALDPNIAAMADEKLKATREHFPDNAFIASQKLKVGDTYQVGCWVSRPTTVKVKP